MYKEIYNIPFQSVDEVNYKVVIEKEGFTGSSTELIGASSPFITEISLDNPLSPYRLGTATLKIFGGDYLQNIFAANPQGVRVKLLKNNQIEWLGFVTNDTYSQDYSNDEFVYEIELVNPLSTLKYKKFKSNLDIITFYQLIVDAIKATNSEIRKLYLPTTITDESNQNIYELVSTSTSNYIDEQGKEMNYYEILEEIAKYLCLTITIDKDIVYFLDYTGISKNYNSYLGYTFNSNGTVTKDVTTINLPNSNTIQLLGYSGDSSTLQINSGKNKAKVTCSLFDIDNILPEFDDKSAKEYVFKRKIFENNNNVIVHKYYNQPKYTFFNCVPNNNVLQEFEGNRKATEEERLGSIFIKSVKYDNNNKPSKLNFSNEIQVKNFNNREDIGNLMLSENNRIIKIQSNRVYIFNKITYFAINFKIKFTESEDQYDEKDTTYTTTMDLGLNVKLKIGDYYWNGNDWTTTESKFKVPYLNKGTERMWKGKYFNTDNINTFELYVPTLEGYIFKAPDFNLIGKPELTIYAFDSSIHKNNNVMFTYIKDLSFNYAISNNLTIYDDIPESKNDIVYENKISDVYVEEADEVDLKICTFPDNYTKLCYSTTFTNNDFLKTLKYIPLNITDKPEKIIINKTIEYFKEPKYDVSIPINNKVIYPYTIITDSNLSGKKFIYAGNEIDYEFETNNINLKEI